ncbi:MAG: hypothetical protein KDE56_03255, partial [Anaerolineales bacterium]|nr:hypothetical protein [Anaerolineales bacterium]
KALAAGGAQQDQRVAAQAWLGRAQLGQGQWFLAAVVPPLAKAEAIAREMGYPEVLAETAQLHGDLELAQDEPDYHRLLAHYAEALLQAQAFNGVTLARTVAYLVDLLTAIAADGQGEAAAQMAVDLVRLGREMGVKETAVAALRQLAEKLVG